MALVKDQIIDLYRKRAANYDISANLYYLIGFRETRYRKLAIRELDLRPGNTVVEIGCGTGLNFNYLEQAVGPEGRIIGVDLTDKMLAVARERIARNGWPNVELIKADAAAYTFPDRLNGILSTFAITLIPEYENIIGRGADALDYNGRMVIVDLRKPDRWPMWVVKFMVWLTRPFGTSLDIAERKPWQAVEDRLADAKLTKLFGGFVFISSGTKR